MKKIILLRKVCVICGSEFEPNTANRVVCFKRECAKELNRRRVKQYGIIQRGHKKCRVCGRVGVLGKYQHYCDECQDKRVCLKCGSIFIIAELTNKNFTICPDCLESMSPLEREGLKGTTARDQHFVSHVRRLEEVAVVVEQIIRGYDGYRFETEIVGKRRKGPLYVSSSERNGWSDFSVVEMRTGRTLYGEVGILDLEKAMALYHDVDMVWISRAGNGWQGKALLFEKGIAKNMPFEKIIKRFLSEKQRV